MRSRAAAERGRRAVSAQLSADEGSEVAGSANEAATLLVCCSCALQCWLLQRGAQRPGTLPDTLSRK